VRSACFSLVAVVALAAMPTVRTETARCTIQPERSLLLMHVEKDTTFPHAEVEAEFMSSSGVRPGPHDSLLAVQGTPMPGARVRLLQVDSATQATLRAAGITDPHPVAFIRAAPYRADCRTVRWNDSLPWVERGDTGYARATLAPPSQWIAGTPMFIILHTWYYPYPRQRALAFDIPADRRLASANAMYSLNVLLEAGGQPMRDFAVPTDTASLRRVLEWTRSHLSDAELEPVRELVRRAILKPDWETVRSMPSRLRGSYAVTMEADGSRGTWYFRTEARPRSSWPDRDTITTIATLLSSPHISGYRLVGYGGPTRDELVVSQPSGPGRRLPFVWLVAEDRPTVAGNEARHVLRGQLEFTMAAAPAQLWDILDVFVRPLSPRDSVVLMRMPEIYARENRQPRLPITLRLDRSGSVRADTVLTMKGKTLRMSVVRLDTISVESRF
jgi:hypothetical protein